MTFKYAYYCKWCAKADMIKYNKYNFKICMKNILRLEHVYRMRLFLNKKLETSKY